MNHSTALLTDKYELTMLQAALTSGRAYKKATFELFARSLNGRKYGVVGGVNRAIQAVKDFQFTEEQIDTLRDDPVFTEELFEYLRNYKFTGTIIGYPEGSLYFPNSPILTVQGFFGDSVLLETILLSILNHDSAVATASSRIRVAATKPNGERLPLIEMGSRRAHEEAAVDSAAAAYMTGFDGTSNLEAHKQYNIPALGTSAHAFTLAYPTEKEAFAAQVDALGVGTTLLVDTYNTTQGIRNAIEVAGSNLGGIRIDSGDLYDESVKARQLLDSLGAVNTKIVLSSDMDEYSISELLERRAPIDSVGVGTRVVTGSGVPTAGMVYKLVEIENDQGEMIPVSKNSSEKQSTGGLKRVFRTYSHEGILEDEFFLLPEDQVSEVPVTAIPVQVPLTENTALFSKDIESARWHHSHELKTLPAIAKTFEKAEAYITSHKL